MAIEMHASLASEGGSKLKMVLTYVDKLPSSCMIPIYVDSEMLRHVLCNVIPFPWFEMCLQLCQIKVTHAIGEDLNADGKEAPSTSPPTGKGPNPLPIDEQQHIIGRPTVAPAIAGRARPKASAAFTLHNDSFHGLLSLLLSVLASFLLLQHWELEIRLGLM
ncbi:hypothetical protein Cgig2_019352 [Carnegiea gigantea]|uniref:Uncharacterized protein n=1 Tax=Carnegiea gigantea TaxID=171969 RepID=A0A9Q1GIG2_9CARY|nr:hypothetical protein Cgig2_019352 [Carnegiea gigantea]